MDQSSSNRPAAERSLSRRERMRHEAHLAILGAAARVFRERGFSDASMRDIAAAADLSPANIYHYFRSKDEIIYFCQDRTLDRLLDIAQAVRARRSPVPERMRALATAHVRCLIDGVEGMAAHFEVDPATPALREAIRVKRERYKQAVSGLITLGIRRGEFRPCNVKYAMRGFLGALNWTPHWYPEEGSDSAAEIAQRIADYAVAGLMYNRPKKKGD